MSKNMHDYDKHGAFYQTSEFSGLWAQNSGTKVGARLVVSWKFTLPMNKDGRLVLGKDTGLGIRGFRVRNSGIFWTEN